MKDFVLWWSQRPFSAVLIAFGILAVCYAIGYFMGCWMARRTMKKLLDDEARWSNLPPL